MTTDSLSQLINSAAQLDSLDEACALIQDGLDIAYGDNAAVFFSDCEDWHPMSRNERKERLTDYVKYELVASPSPVSVKVARLVLALPEVQKALADYEACKWCSVAWRDLGLAARAVCL